MQQNPYSSEKIDQQMMVMAIHNLRKAVVAAGGVLNLYSREAGAKLTRPGEAQYIAELVEGMQQSGRKMLHCIDEILAATDKANSAEEFGVGLRHDGNSFPVVQQSVPYVIAGGEYAHGDFAGEHPVSPPAWWNM
ncbi:MAG: hypothetical protein OEV23_00575 [Gallionella sp.]|nr:hypothetical protein [Gallionella sp.]